MFPCHFVDPDIKVKVFFEKEGAIESEDVDFEIGGRGTCCTLVLGLEEKLMQSLTAFYWYFL